jgi:glycosyltransferase involved in cell wall biosynthesis
MIDKNILLITPGFPADEDDFLCIPPLQEFIVGFKSKYPSSKLIVMSLHYPHYKRDYIWNEIPVMALGGTTITFTKPLMWMKAIRRGKKIAHQNKIDLIHSLWYGECALIGNIMSKKFNCPHICTLMGQDVKSSNKYLRYLNNRKIRIIALSKNQAEQFYNLTNKRVDEIIHWGIADQPVNYSERDIDLLAVGSLIPLKNYSLFVEMIERIIPLKPELNAVLVGSGPEEKKLKQMIKEKKLENNIHLTGLLKRTDIFRLMRRSRIFVHPSKFEGSGYVFAEALVNGMNIVSFNVGYAKPNEKWFVAKDEQSMIDLTAKLIFSELDFKPVNLFPLSETINNYASLYNYE